jgi:hypothetical protein
VSLKTLPANILMVWDAVFKQYCNHISLQTLYDYYGSYSYAVSKRQLNTKEIRTLVRKLTATAVSPQR